MSDPRPTPFTASATPEAEPLSAPPARPESLDPSDAPLRIFLNWAVLVGGLGVILLVGGLVL